MPRWGKLVHMTETQNRASYIGSYNLENLFQIGSLHNIYETMQPCTEKPCCTWLCSAFVGPISMVAWMPLNSWDGRPVLVSSRKAPSYSEGLLPTLGVDSRALEYLQIWMKSQGNETGAFTSAEFLLSKKINNTLTSSLPYILTLVIMFH